ncbi:MAG: HYR domain-containing protein [Thiohalocapsa sp.]|nr:HYR domain-containing protein [Thiohalocapsa sp.]
MKRGYTGTNCAGTQERRRRFAAHAILGGVLVGCLAAPTFAAVPAWPMNDTGIDWWADADSAFLSSEPADYPGQDASVGRDAEQHDGDDGHAGFSFVKLDEAGRPLPPDAAQWSCVRDLVTGLVWETKTETDGLHARDDRFTWYRTDPTANGGDPGFRNADGATCFGYSADDPVSYCNSEAFAARVNAEGLCGADDWRVPEVEELRSIVDYSRFFPAIDPDFFPNTAVSHYWTASPSALASGFSWYVFFPYGTVLDGFNANAYHVRLVRGGQAFADAFSLTVEVSAGADFGRVRSTPEGIDCGERCAADFAPGQTVTLTALPAAGYAAQWGGECAGSGDACDILLDADRQVDVAFIDVVAPVVTAPADIRAEATAIETPLEIGTASTDDGSAVSSDAPGAFPLGTTLVTWTATDASGNTGTAEQRVTVVDTTAPVLTVPADIEVEAAGATTEVAIGEAVATDLFGPVEIVNDAPSGLAFPLGTTLVTWSATDANGNRAEATQRVRVVDTTPPTVTAPADIEAEASAVLTPIPDLGAATTDDGSPVSNDAPPDGFPLGETTVIWSATDESGNTGTATQIVTVSDTTPPRLSLPAAVTAPSTGASTAVELGPVDADDLFGPVTTNNDAPSGGFPPGATLVNWTASDANGNAAAATQLVVVYDGTVAIDGAFNLKPAAAEGEDGQPPNGGSRRVALSADGRLLVFESSARNLVSESLAADVNLFALDRDTGQVQLVNRSSAGVPGNGTASELQASVSADGRFVAFHSDADNLVPDDGNAVADVFVRDLIDGTMTRVSIDSVGTEGDAPSRFAAISADGRYVAFQSRAANLVSGDTNGAFDIFVHDRRTGLTERVGAGEAGGQLDDDSFGPRISADGRYVAFNTAATLPGFSDDNGAVDVLLHDRATGQTELVSVDPAGNVGDGESTLAALSADGRHVAFRSAAANLVAGDSNAVADIFVRDLDAGFTERVSVDSAGNESNGPSLSPAISADGRYVAFHSAASNLVPGDANGAPDVFIHDRELGLTRLLSVDPAGRPGNAASLGAVLSADGLIVAFESDAGDLVPGDVNGLRDIFVVAMGVPGENYAPVAEAGEDRTLSCTGPTTPVTLDGGASSDVNDDPLSYLWSGTPDPEDVLAPIVQLPVGSHVFELVVSDGLLDSAPDQVSIIVEDLLAPEIGGIGDRTLEATGSAGAELVFSPEVTDICDEAPVVTVSPEGPYALGATTVTISAEDASGNVGRQTVRVTVVDTTAPVLTVPADIEVEAAGATTEVVIGEAVATDLFGPVEIVNDAPSGLAFPLGTTLVTWSATDANGNRAEATQSVTVSRGPALYHGSVRGVGDSWQTIRLPQAYAEPVIVATVDYLRGQPPAVARVRNAAGDRFELRVQSPGDLDVLDDYGVRFVVVEAGVYTESVHGITMEAATTGSTRTDGQRAGWIGERIEYANRYDEPVVVGQVMSENDPAWSVFWARGVDRLSPPDSDHLFVGKHVGEDTQTERADETIGYVVIEAGAGSVDGLLYQAGVDASTVKGSGSADAPFMVGHTVPGARNAVVSVAAMIGGNGGWPVLFDAGAIESGTLDLAIEEDRIRDLETFHAVEPVAFLVLGDETLADGPRLHQGEVGDLGSDWQRVSLPHGYMDPVVVASVQYGRELPPAVVRIRDVDGSSFDLRVQAPDDADLPAAYVVHYVAAESGTYTLAEHGIALEANKILSTRTDGKRSGWVGEPVDYRNVYTQPVVLGQVMTANDAWSVFWASGADRRSAPGPDALFVGKHVGEDPNGSRLDETIGYLVLEAGTGMAGGTTYEAGLSAAVVKGTGSLDAPFDVRHGLAEVWGGVASSAAMKGADGGWPVFFASDPFAGAALRLAIDEDRLADDETFHAGEAVGYLIFGRP